MDDAAFSCGGTLARLARMGWNVTLCTVFTQSVMRPTGFALACQLDKGLGPEVDYMALRRAEDAAACAALAVQPHWLDLPEAPHRGYGDAGALFGPPQPMDRAVTPLTRALVSLLDAGPDLVLAPQAVGGHVDHVLLVRALCAVLPARMPVLWWTDFPYCRKPDSHPAQPFAAEMAAWPKVEFTGDAESRRRACGAYRTQLGFQFGGEQGLHQALAQAGPLEHFRAQGRASLPTGLYEAA
ncbi:PIG-L deacetylase family protein [Dankookia sp. P2]|uniref:PIG-L deacetylase family protein n=1 Tax=Dankookia sp. P2 TaxID=3423955 RepID=UPI003D67A635